MSEVDETDASFADVFKRKFGTGVDTKARLKAERRAGLTPKERHRGGNRGPLRNVQMNFRGTAKTKKLVAALVDKLCEMRGDEVSQADVFEEAIEKLAKAYKVELADTKGAA